MDVEGARTGNEAGHERGTRQIAIEDRDEGRNGGHLVQRPQHVCAPFSPRLHVLILTSSRPYPVLILSSFRPRPVRAGAGRLRRKAGLCQHPRDGHVCAQGEGDLLPCSAGYWQQSRAGMWAWAVIRRNQWTWADNARVRPCDVVGRDRRSRAPSGIARRQRRRTTRASTATSCVPTSSTLAATRG